RAVDDLSRVLDERAARADASLKELAASLAAGGDTEAAAAVARTQSHVEQAWSGSKRDLQSRGSGSQQGGHHTKPAAGEPKALSRRGLMPRAAARDTFALAAARS